ncbi:MAG TPA: hypothetical protein VFS67_33730 [Polyangiaceae bacterium]|nr:hypothetical protein [Polyangiaceae bacterium]
MSHLYANPDADPGRDPDSERARVRQLINDQIHRGVTREQAEINVLGPSGSLLRRWYAGAQS